MYVFYFAISLVLFGTIVDQARKERLVAGVLVDSLCTLERVACTSGGRCLTNVV